MGFRKIMAAVLTVGMVMSFIPASVMAARPGWEGNDDEGWYYYTSETECVNADWMYIGGYWYYFEEDGRMAQNSWEYIGGVYYHFDAKGHMQKNTWVEDKVEEGGSSLWSYLDGSGRAVMGWYKVKGVWYYFDPDWEGCMSFDCWVKDSGTGRYYRFDKNGRYLKNKWYHDTESDEWYYLDSSGLTCRGWTKVSKKWYYFSTDSRDKGVMQTGCISVGNKYYFLDSNGAMQTGWIRLNSGEDTEWIYAGSDGALYQDRWLKSSGVWYYFVESLLMVRGVNDKNIGGRLYDFAQSGACKNPYSGRPAAA